MAQAPAAFDLTQHGCAGNAGGAAWWLTAASYGERLGWIETASQAHAAGGGGYPAFVGYKRLYEFLLIVLEGVCVSDGTGDCACGRARWTSSSVAKTKPLWVHIGDGIHGLDGDAGQDWDLAALFSELVLEEFIPPGWSEDLTKDGTTVRAGIVQKAVVILANLHAFGEQPPARAKVSDNSFHG